MKQNIYQIVTNDELEQVVKDDVVGIQAVADYMGYSIEYITKCLFYNRWSKKQIYKAYKVGEKQKPVVMTKTKRKKRDLSGYTAKEKREMLRDYHREYNKKYREENAERLKEYQRQWYINKVLKEVAK